MPDIGTVFITKKRGQRTMRLRVDTRGTIQVSMPWIIPRRHALEFVASKREWIKRQQAERSFTPYHGMLFGKTLKLHIESDSVSKRIKRNDKTVIVPLPEPYDPANEEHIDKIQKAVMSALRCEAETLLLPRLRELAGMYDFEYKSSSIKSLTGRWGSCDSTRHIALSLFLVQLPIELIDYVIIHELAHTRCMNHSAAFWQQVARHCPDYKDLRRQMKGLQPRLYDAKAFMA